MEGQRQTRILSLILAVLLGSLFFGCGGSELGAREKGAIGGGALGAGLGAIIGHQTGSTGAGLAIGAAAGALAGGLIGNEIDKTDVALDDRDRRIAGQEETLRENSRIIEELKRRGADVRSTDRGVVINLPDVLFEFDSARLRSDAIRSTKEIASVIKGYPDRRIAVEGHTDSIGTIPYNQRLSKDRARSVVNEMVAQGVSRRRMTSGGFGESDPIASNRTDAGRKRNRRVEIILEN